MLKLYTFFRSSASFRVRIALAYKGIPYEPRFTSLPKMEHRAPDFLRLNPQGLVPAMADDAGQVFSQSMAMIEYLDETHPTPALMPKSALERWYVRAVSQLIACEIHPLNNVRVLKYLKSAYDLDDKQINGQWYSHWIAEGLAAVEGLLAAEKRHGKYCLGDQFTMADTCLVPQIFNAQRFNCDTSSYPICMGIFAECMKLEAVLSTEPNTQGDKF